MYKYIIINYIVRPKIISLNGHLIFEAAEHKNISFKTIGSGCVNLNGIDLTSAPKIVTYKYIINEIRQ